MLFFTYIFPGCCSVVPATNLNAVAKAQKEKTVNMKAVYGIVGSGIFIVLVLVLTMLFCRRSKQPRK